MKMKTWIVSALSILASSHAFADQTVTLHLDTVASNRDVRWDVAEVRSGLTVAAKPVYNIETYGAVLGFGIPFTDNDGFWVARTTFRLPANAVNPTLTITTLGVDDRTVVGLNGVQITASGTTAAGHGSMTFQDGGPNMPYDFPFASGPENVVVTTGFRIGFNKLQVIVNNTNNGIFGAPSPQGPTSFGMTGTVTYTLPAP